MKILRLLLLILFINLFCVTAFAQVNIQGNNYMEYAWDKHYEKNYFENWTDLALQYQNWRAGVRYEFHQPPFPFAQDTSSRNELSQRYIEYQNTNMSVTAGNFYTLLGRGLVLRSFENRILRWDTNIDGGKFEYFNQYFDAKVIAGKPRDLSNDRQEALYGGSLDIKPMSSFHAGGTILKTKLDQFDDVQWGSVFGGYSTSFGDFYIEKGFKDFPENVDSDAWYASGNLFLGNLTALMEYRKYQNFNIEQGSLTYNNPPTVYREHLYTLLNRAQLVQDPGNEEGYMLELSYPLWDYGIITFNHSRTTDSLDNVLYREYYTQIDFDPLDNLSLVAGGGEQKDIANRYLNFVGTAKYGINARSAIKGILEHQQVKVLLNNRQYWSQAYTLSYDYAAKLTLSFLAERSTDQFAKKDYWMGGQLDVQLPYKLNLTVFGGSRRKGKICAGGVCIVRPEFEGIEVRLLGRL